ncbi:37S ribosomal protein S18 mitochondrial [Spathaspora sp. JA1]|nr:37S ribosomal protein S18 mitochondrial [Spathaspora sp. JA1]
MFSRIVKSALNGSRIQSPSIINNINSIRTISSGSILNAQPIRRAKKPLQSINWLKNDEKVVGWKIYAQFSSNNTKANVVAVVEDTRFLEKNPNLSHNEQVIYYLQLPHRVVYSLTTGHLGFRGVQRSEYEAGFQVGSKLFKTIQDRNLFGPTDKVELVLKGMGKGREAFTAALLGKEGQALQKNIVRVSDATVLKFGGSRSKKPRRV